jgi:hypothetical protein
MKLAPALLFVVACGGSKPATTTTTTTTTEEAPPPTTTGPTTPPPAPGPTVVTTTTTSAKPTPKGTKAQYSCFSYVTGNNKTPRHACMRSDECGPYLDQAKSVGGIRELSGCANVASVYCFHQVATKEEPDGLDVCQATLDECKTARTDVVKAKMSVDSDCAQR